MLLGYWSERARFREQARDYLRYRHYHQHAWHWFTDYSDPTMGTETPGEHVVLRFVHDMSPGPHQAAQLRMQAERTRFRVSTWGVPWTWLQSLDPAWRQLEPHPSEPQGLVEEMKADYQSRWALRAEQSRHS